MNLFIYNFFIQSDIQARQVVHYKHLLLPQLTIILLYFPQYNVGEWTGLSSGGPQINQHYVWLET